MVFFLNGLEGNENTEGAEKAQIQPIYQQRFHNLWRVPKGKASRGIGYKNEVKDRKNNGRKGGKDYCAVDFPDIGHRNVKDGQADGNKHFFDDIEIILQPTASKRVNQQIDKKAEENSYRERF